MVTLVSSQKQPIPTNMHTTVSFNNEPTGYIQSPYEVRKVYRTHVYVRVGTMATKFKNLLTDDKYEITESDAE